MFEKHFKSIIKVCSFLEVFSDDQLHFSLDETRFSKFCLDKKAFEEKNVQKDEIVLLHLFIVEEVFHFLHESLSSST